MRCRAGSGCRPRCSRARKAGCCSASPRSTTCSFSRWTAARRRSSGNRPPDAGATFGGFAKPVGGYDRSRDARSRPPLGNDRGDGGARGRRALQRRPAQRRRLAAGSRESPRRRGNCRSYTVGFGSTTRPHDLAVMKVQAPEAVFAEDHVRGQVTLKDDMPPGLPFTVSIKDGDRVLWEQKLATQGTDLRTGAVRFSRSSQSVQERVKGQRAGVQVSGVPIELKVAVSDLPGDGEPGNNRSTARRPRAHAEAAHPAARRPRRAGRRATCAISSSATSSGRSTPSSPAFHAGERLRARHDPEQFPDDLAHARHLRSDHLRRSARGALARPASCRRSAISWRSAAARSSSSMARAAGSRSTRDSPLGPLFPVEWKGAALREHLGHLVLSRARADRSRPLRSRRIAQHNAETLARPAAAALALRRDGAARRGDARFRRKRRAQPAGRAGRGRLRPFGAGRVLYHAIEDSWRWRYEVADLYHAQVLEPGRRLDRRAALRRARQIRLARCRRDHLSARASPRICACACATARGIRSPMPSPMPCSTATARASPPSASRPMKMRAAFSTAAPRELEPGSYEVAVESAAIAAQDALARTSFKVEPRETGELTQLTLNEELLRQMATASGGQYLREENTPTARRPARAAQPRARHRERDRALAELLVVRPRHPPAHPRMVPPQTRRDAVDSSRASSSRSIP